MSILSFLLLSMNLLGCGNECSFWSRCNGNVLEVCGEGVDQMFNRRIQSTDCGDESTCVEVGDDALCASNPVTTCTIGADAVCDEDLAGEFFCDRGYLVWESCDEDQDCVLEGTSPGCSTPCDSSFEVECDHTGSGWYGCVDGYEAYVPCDEGTCRVEADGSVGCGR